LFVIFQHRLPTCLAHDYSLPNLLRIQQKLIQAHDGHRKLMRAANGRCSGRISVSRLVNSLNEVIGVLKFNRQEESGRGIDALSVATFWLRGTAINVVDPKIPAGSIRLAI